MSLFRFTLDGNILADEPEGWDQIVSELKRDKESRGQLLIMDLTLRFNGKTDGYNILKPLIDCQGFCSFSELTIEESCNNDSAFVTIYEGILFYTDVREFLTPCVLECKLTDNSYFAKIDNNQSIEAYVNVGRSKNDVVITDATQNLIEFFDVVSGAYTGQVICFSVFDSFRFIIDYMTDDEMGFVSDYFSTGAGKDMFITTGEQIRLGSGGGSTIFPFISFSEIFDEVNKKINIGFSIEDVAGVKRMRIEPASYFYSQATSVTLPDAVGIIKSVNTSELYSKLEIGSSETLAYSLGLTDFPTTLPFIGWKEESYTLTGKCNIDNTLNLVSDWIIDSNIIQDVFTNGNSDYDEDIFFIMADSAILRAIKYDIFNTGTPIFYNGFLTNDQTANRWLGGIPNSIALYLAAQTPNGFQASRDSDLNITLHQAAPVTEYTSAIVAPSTVPIELFANDYTSPNYDGDGIVNNYGNGTPQGNPVAQGDSRFTIPANGLYFFETYLRLANVHTFPAPPNDSQLRVLLVDITFSLYNAADALQDSSTGSFIFANINKTPQTVSCTHTWSVNPVATDYVIVDYFIRMSGGVSRSILATISADSFFRTVDITTGGSGIFQNISPEDFKAYMFEFDYPLSFADYQTIIANPLKQIIVSDGNNVIPGWIDNMKYSHKEGKAKFVLNNSQSNSDC